MTPNEIIALGALFISGLSLIRSFSKDSKGSAAELTTMIVKLEQIGSDIAEIKKDLRSVKADLREHSERITRTEQKIEALEKMVQVYHHCENFPE
jgi:chromosome segregation ATPase